MVEQHVGHPADVVLELAVRDPLVDAWLVGRPDDGGPLGMGGDVPVDTIEARVQPPSSVPREVDLLGVDVEHLVPGMEPIEDPGLLAPEPRGILERSPVKALVLLHGFQMGALAHPRLHVEEILAHGTSGTRKTGEVRGV
jgi:hypothetical protein